MARDERAWRILVRHRRGSQYSPVSCAFPNCAQAAGRTARAGESSRRVARSRLAIPPAFPTAIPALSTLPAIGSVQGSLLIPGQPGQSSTATQQSSVRSSRSMDVISSSFDRDGLTRRSSGRDYHATHHENGNFSTDASIKAKTVTWRLYTDLHPIQAFRAGDYRPAPEWYRQVEFPVE